MEVQNRQANAEDLSECADIFIESLSDMRARHNLPSRTLPSHSDMLAFYQHVHSTGIFHVAEVEGRIAALACAILRDRLWFLSGYWARPELQRQKIGMPVLREVWNEGKAAGAKDFYVWASIDLPAMASYMKLGMLPGCQILSFEGTPQMPAPAPGYNVTSLNKSFAMDLDQAALSTRREVDHDFFSKTGSQGRQVFHDEQSIGYYYFNGGNIGPAAWTEDHHAASLLTVACREASESNSQVSLEIPGMNHAALRFAFDSGLMLTGSSHLLMSSTFGRIEQYLPSGPGLF